MRIWVHFLLCSSGVKLKHLFLISLVFAGIGNPSRCAAYVSDTFTGEFVEAQGTALFQPLAPLREWRLPVRSKTQITSCFGPRHLMERYYDFHEGIDFAVPKRTPVRAVAAGKVIWLGNAGCAGRFLILQHQLRRGVFVLSLYKHLQRFGVRINQNVRAGQRIAWSGASGKRLLASQQENQRGCVTGPHLHLELKFLNAQYTLRDIKKLLRQTRGHLSDAVFPADPSLFFSVVKNRCTPAS